jgi:hypothetical protein
MPTFKIPKPITVQLDPWLALVTAEYLHTVSDREQAPTLCSMLDSVAAEISVAAYKAYPLLKAEHLLEQTQAYAQELLSGVDTVWEEQTKTMEDDQ